MNTEFTIERITDQMLSHVEDLDKLDLETLDKYFKFLVFHLSDSNDLHLTTWFSRLSYIGLKYNVPFLALKACHYFRKNYKPEKLDSDSLLLAVNFAIIYLLKLLHGNSQLMSNNLVLLEEEWSDFVQGSKTEFHSFLPLVKGSVIRKHADSETLEFWNYETGVMNLVKYNVTELNENFNRSIQHLGGRIRLPVEMHLMDCRMDENGTLFPAAMIIDPDYLVDVTAVAECFMPGGEYPMSYLLKKMTPKPSSRYILIGNLANAILDELLTGKAFELKTFLIESFKKYPLEFSMFDDREMWEIIQNIKTIYANLLIDCRHIKNDAPNLRLRIEPSFISPSTGLQGRLDVLKVYTGEDGNDKAEIIELKSGKPFKPNVHGINRNHFIQTLLYDLLIKEAFGKKLNPINYILYCKISSDRMKYAPVVRNLQYEALAIRNDIVALEHMIIDMDTEKDSLFERINARYFDTEGGFIRSDADNLARVFGQLTTMQKQYFRELVRLVSSENYKSKTGGHKINGRSGFAAFWKDDPGVKVEHFNMLRNLMLDKAALGAEEQVLRLSIRDESEITNFRQGDIGVMYPTIREGMPHKGQLIKGSITRLEGKEIHYRMRSKISAFDDLLQYDDWNIEHDYLESSVNNLYESIIQYCLAPAERKDLILGYKAPEQKQVDTVDFWQQHLTQEQRNIVAEMMTCRDYYMLWGPPGTGKTSVVLKELIYQSYYNSEEKILLLAYTNRAVDEICDAIESVSPDLAAHYIRVGSSYSVGDQFKERLLQEKIKGCNTREEVRLKIQSCRLFVGTVASLLGKNELFKLVKIDRLVVDEASQILEPAMAGLMSRAKTCILIGDHKQLPAVISLPESRCKIKASALQELGINNLSMSLFERLYRRCEQMNWAHAYGQLSYQGRMHETIMNFVGSRFYGDELKAIDHLENKRERLSQSLTFVYDPIPKFGDSLLDKRMIFIDTQTEHSNLAEIIKTNELEARRAVEIAMLTYDSLISKSEDAIGIICPFRAQISLVKQNFEDLYEQVPDFVKIDTVERFQGGARDIIILSTCANNSLSLDAIKSIDVDGTDRKLNVALTRAREQVFILGSEKVLKEDDNYLALINYCRETD
jgi:DNA replication ATP-dependent helicase Dna2